MRYLKRKVTLWAVIRTRVHNSRITGSGSKEFMKLLTPTRHQHSPSNNFKTTHPIKDPYGALERGCQGLSNKPGLIPNGLGLRALRGSKAFPIVTTPIENRFLYDKNRFDKISQSNFHYNKIRIQTTQNTKV